MGEREPLWAGPCVTSHQLCPSVALGAVPLGAPRALKRDGGVTGRDQWCGREQARGSQAGEPPRSECEVRPAPRELLSGVCGGPTDAVWPLPFLCPLPSCPRPSPQRDAGVGYLAAHSASWFHVPGQSDEVVSGWRFIWAHGGR